MEQLINITDLLLVEVNKNNLTYLARREGEGEDDSEDPLGGGGEGEPEEEPGEDEDGEV